MKYFNLILLVFLILLGCSSCWAPRCPMNSCHVKYEHIHEGGEAYRGGSIFTAKKHWPWTKKEDYKASERKKDVNKKNRKWKKLFIWERV
jgi:hypothetical protein